ncbi:MAG: copper resistance protein NlpE N-terminal domain-containing protein, partial [Burkholderiaceae bacterium]
MKFTALCIASLGLVGVAGAADQVKLDQAYTGTLPCADCAGIRTSIVFSQDSGGALSYRSEETYLGTREGDRSYGSCGNAVELGGTRLNPWAARMRIDPAFAESRRHFLVLSPTVIELVGANGERAASMLDYKLVLERNAPRTKPVERRLFAGTLRRVLDRWELVQCGGPVLP